MKKKGYLSVGNKHQLYFETHGRDDGIPVLFLHGGPGANFNPKDLDFFDLNKYFVILFDQRGAGQSEPYGELAFNSTQELIQDCKKLLDFLHLDKVLLFGGSWGATLAILFSINYPNKVTGMILRGLFLANKASREFLEQGLSKDQFPKQWRRLESLVPDDQKHRVTAYYQQQILNGDSHAQSIHAYEWDRYCLCLAYDKISEEQVKKKMEGFSGVEKARILMHYTKHDFFIPENYILEHSEKIPSVPISIVHGTKDWICRPHFAEQFQEKHPMATVHFVEGGHSINGPMISSKLKEILNNWK